MSQNLTNEKATVVHIMTRYHQTPNHYLSQCGTRFISPCSVIRPSVCKFYGTLHTTLECHGRWVQPLCQLCCRWWHRMQVVIRTTGGADGNIKIEIPTTACFQCWVMHSYWPFAFQATAMASEPLRKIATPVTVSTMTYVMQRTAHAQMAVTPGQWWVTHIKVPMKTMVVK